MHEGRTIYKKEFWDSLDDVVNHASHVLGQAVEGRSARRRTLARRMARHDDDTPSQESGDTEPKEVRVRVPEDERYISKVNNIITIYGSTSTPTTWVMLR
eukprot:scaffold82379_cov30-Tisochrysis_lutea.AAC.1